MAVCTHDDEPKAKAREKLTAPTFVGTDANGARHYWSYYDWTIAVVDGDTVTTYRLDNTPCEDLGDWRDHVTTKRGWDDCRIVGSEYDPLEGL